MTDDRLKQCKRCTNYISSNYFDEEPWCRVKPYHQMPKQSRESQDASLLQAQYLCANGMKDGDGNG